MFEIVYGISILSLAPLHGVLCESFKASANSQSRFAYAYRNDDACIDFPRALRSRNVVESVYSTEKNPQNANS